MEGDECAVFEADRIVDNLFDIGIHLPTVTSGFTYHLATIIPTTLVLLYLAIILSPLSNDSVSTMLTDIFCLLRCFMTQSSFAVLIFSHFGSLGCSRLGHSTFQVC